MRAFGFPYLFAFVAALATCVAGAPALLNDETGRSISRRNEILKSLFPEWYKPITYDVSKNVTTEVKIEYVNNSGACEETAGVNQYSGHVTLGTSKIFFWFFEARNNPSTAPVIISLSGGPGCSSIYQAFREAGGPCFFDNDNSLRYQNNTNSFNNVASMLYIDQPGDTGYSFGDYGNHKEATTIAAVQVIWKVFQAFLAAFPTYEQRELCIYTSSYGGRYGPELALHIQQQNKAIESGSVTGKKINLVALLINNGMVEFATQWESQIEFMYNNTYKSLLTSSQYKSLTSAFESQCAPAYTRACADTGMCKDAIAGCHNRIVDIASSLPSMKGWGKGLDVYDIRGHRTSQRRILQWLNTNSNKAKIGAPTTNWRQCTDSVWEDFFKSGDITRSSLDALSKVAQSGVATILAYGDADIICNWHGGLHVANSIRYLGSSTFASKPLAPYKVNGHEMGKFKTVNNLAFLRVYDAGHATYEEHPELGLHVFTQMMVNKGISST